MEFAQPPPDMNLPPPSQGPPPIPLQHNYNVPPPLAGTGPPQIRQNMFGQSHNQNNHFAGAHHAGAGKPGHPYFKPFASFNRGNFGMTQDDFDGKRLRKSVMRKTVDYNASIVRSLENRIWQRDFRDRHALQPESIYIPELLPPPSYLDNPSNAVTTRFVKTATNKMRCPIFTLAWTPEGRRLVTGASSGEFTLWNGLTFNFETILQAHDVPVRTMVWSHNDSWMVTGDHAGYVKYWQSNMNNVKMFQAHKEPIRGISFSPTDSKFVSCSDDGTLRVWDFLRCQEERVLRGHGADVKCVHWHPQKSLIVSGSKDNQQPIKLWDPKGGQALATLHAHKSTVMDLKWNDNGNWLVTASRDHLLKLFDLRNLKEEVQIFRGHKKEASSVSWHPVHEGLFSSGGSDGSILFWNVGTDKEIGGIETAHDSIVWTLAWHPLGHILCSGSNDHTIKFWTRNRPGDAMRDKYNLNTLPASLAMLDECEYEEAIIPGMGLGPEDKVEFTESLTADKGFIPGLDLDPNKTNDLKDKEKKVPYSKPIPRNFQAQWNDSRNNDDENDSRDYKDAHSDNGLNVPTSLDPIDSSSNIVSGIVVYGKFVSVLPGSNLAKVIRQGPEALNKYISLGEVEELLDVIPFEDNDSQSSDEQFSNSPTRKKPNIENRNHNAQIIYNTDMDNRQRLQQSQTSTATNIPSLLGLKVPAPDIHNFGDDVPKPQERNFDDKNRPSPWATGPLAPANTGYGFNQPSPNNFNPFNMNINPFGGNNNNNNSSNNELSPFDGPQNNDFRGNGRNFRFDGPFNNNFNDFSPINNNLFEQNQSNHFRGNNANDMNYEDSPDFRGNDGANVPFNNGLESRNDLKLRASGRPSRFSDNNEWGNDSGNSGSGTSGRNNNDRDNNSRNNGNNNRRQNHERRSHRNNRNNRRRN